MNGALLVVDSSLTPCDGSLLVCRIDDELRIKHTTVPIQNLIKSIWRTENVKRYQEKLVTTMRHCQYLE